MTELFLDDKLYDSPSEITKGFATYCENIYNSHHCVSFDHEFFYSEDKFCETIKETSFIHYPSGKINATDSVK